MCIRDSVKRLEIQIDNKIDISDTELADCYKSADLLLFASLFEGFGMPIIEAQTAGIPVITSNISSMPEVAGSGAMLVDPYSVDDISKSVRSVLQSVEMQENLKEAGYENCKRFSPEVVGQLYSQLYVDVYQTSLQ